MWARRFDLSAKALLQMVHLNGFSPTTTVSDAVHEGAARVTCVGPDVALEQPRPGEALSAVLALAALVVRPDVHRKGRHADVELVAMRAPSCLFVGGASVRLPVSR